MLQASNHRTVANPNYFDSMDPKYAKNTRKFST